MKKILFIAQENKTSRVERAVSEWSLKLILFSIYKFYLSSFCSQKKESGRNESCLYQNKHKKTDVKKAKSLCIMRKCSCFYTFSITWFSSYSIPFDNQFQWHDSLKQLTISIQKDFRYFIAWLMPQMPRWWLA